jgi:excisionase family DNA binding protein
MNTEPAAVPVELAADQPVTDAPSTRAKALREEMLGNALALDEVAYILSLDRTTVAKYLREKTLYGFQIGREWLVPEDELRNYIRSLTEGSPRGRGARQSAEYGQSSSHRGLLERMRDDLPLVGRRQQRAEQHEVSRDKFDRFTGRARHVLTLAQDEAQRLNHNYIGTEHLLLGLVREGEGVAAKVLANLGVELHVVRIAVESIIKAGDAPVTGEVGLTPRCKKVIELAVDEARRLGHKYVGTEHLLLGLVREGDGIAAGVLESMNLQLEKIRLETGRVLGEVSSRQGAADPAYAQPVPPEASELVAGDQDARTCAVCAARSPVYFRFCFNCGAPLESEDQGEKN